MLTLFKLWVILFYFDAVSLMNLRSGCRSFCSSSLSVGFVPTCVQDVCVAKACIQILVTPCLPLVSRPTSPGLPPSSWICIQHELALTLASNPPIAEALSHSPSAVRNTVVSLCGRDQMSILVLQTEQKLRTYNNLLNLYCTLYMLLQ